MEHPIKDLASFFDAQYQARMGTRYPFNGGKDGKLLKDLRAIYSDDEIQEYMAAFFEMPEPFFEQSGYSIGVFRACLPRVIQWTKRGPSRVPSETGWTGFSDGAGFAKLAEYLKKKGKL